MLATHVIAIANNPRRYIFKVSCFPIKILKASAAWVRPVAIIESE